MVRMAYFAFFQTHLQYGILLWSHCGNQLPIFRIEKTAVRVISGANFRAHCKPLFISNIFTLGSLFILECLMYTKANLQKFNIHSDTHSYQTRHRNDIDLTYLRLSKSMNGVNFYGPKFCNKLPIYIRNLEITKLEISLCPKHTTKYPSF